MKGYKNIIWLIAGKAFTVICSCTCTLLGDLWAWRCYCDCTL